MSSTTRLSTLFAACAALTLGALALPAAAYNESEPAEAYSVAPNSRLHTLMMYRDPRLAFYQVEAPARASVTCREHVETKDGKAAAHAD